MEPELKLKCRKNRSKLVNTMLARDDKPCRGVYKQKNLDVDQFCTLGLVFELIVGEYPDQFKWYKMHGGSFYPVSKNDEGEYDEFAGIPACGAIEKWLGVSIESATHISNENDHGGELELATWGHMAQVVLDCPYNEYRERGELWDDN